MLIEWWGRVGRVLRVLHDGYDDYDRRLQMVHTLSRFGQVFTVGLIIVGIGATLDTFRLTAIAAVDARPPKRFQRWQIARRIEIMKDQFILVVLGRPDPLWCLGTHVQA